MGFLLNLKQEMHNRMFSEESKNYRKTGLKTNISNYGWYTCVHCGKKFRKGSIDIDHIVPQSKGGTNRPENLQCLCKYCNRSKGNKTDQTKDDLQLRKKNYSQYKRIEILQRKLIDARKKVNSLKYQLNNADIVEMLNTGKLRVSKLKRSDVKRFYNKLADERGLKITTIDNVHTVLHQIIQLAVEDNYVRQNVSDNLLKELKQSHAFQDEHKRALTVPEQELFLRFLSNERSQYHHWHPIFTVMIGTGMRVGEVCGLRWDDIDLETGMIDVNHTLV